VLLKAGVDISRLERKTRRSLTVVEVIFEDEGQPLIITSTYEGDHGAGSLHYANQAYHIRTPVMQTVRIFNRVRDALSEDFDFVAETDHWHIEYNPD